MPFDQAFSFPPGLREATPFRQGWFPEEAPSSLSPRGSGWSAQLGGVTEVMEAETSLIKDTHNLKM